VLGRLGEHETLLDGAEVVGAGGLGRLEKSGGAATAAAVMDDMTEVQLGRRKNIDGGDSERRAAKADDINTNSTKSSSAAVERRRQDGASGVEAPVPRVKVVNIFQHGASCRGEALAAARDRPRSSSTLEEIAARRT
jgi:hypothetical protein